MSLIRPSSLLTRALRVDAAATLASGLVLVAGAAPLAELLGLPETLLRWAGLGLVPYAAWVGVLARRGAIARPIVGLVVACNALYALDCVVLLASGWLQPTLWGEIFLAAQAAAVVVLAELQFVGLRRSAALSGANA